MKVTRVFDYIIMIIIVAIILAIASLFIMLVWNTIGKDFTDFAKKLTFVNSVKATAFFCMVAGLIKAINSLIATTVRPSIKSEEKEDCDECG